MSVYKRNECDVYSYDFRLDGRRYSGSTNMEDLDEALEFESLIKSDILNISKFCHSVIRKALRTIPARVRANSGYVYVLRSGFFIKIGYSTNPVERIGSIVTSTPDDCEMLFLVPGNLKLEKRLHREFAACHYRREWFFLCGKLKRFVEEFDAHRASKAQTSLHNLPHNLHSDAVNAA